MIGKVIRWDDSNGYGFIECDEDKKWCFVHYSNIITDRKSLTPGEHVEMEFTQTDRGYQAINVKNQ